jgi:hypothetical protein
MELKMKNFVFCLISFIAFTKNANGQIRIVVDTTLAKDGFYFDDLGYKIYGKFKIDTSFFGGGPIRCYNYSSEYSNKILLGKCIFYYPLKTINNGKIQYNDTTKIKMIIYFDNNGNQLKSIYLNSDGSIQYVYIKKEEN